MDFDSFRQQVSKALNLHLTGYKEKQLKRRIEHLMHSQGFKDYREYLNAIKSDEHERNKFLDKITINVSEFFRNKDIFMRLESEYLPELLKNSRRLKIWSAACSNGAEPYSIAIILDELSTLGNHLIHATDLDRNILKEAKKAVYREDLVKNISPDRLNKYFARVNNHYQLNDKIKSKVSFKQHDLLKEKYERDYDLIVCRNVTIYFTRETQNDLYLRFMEALKPGGILFVGATESILNYKQLGLEKLSSWFYMKAH